MIRRAIHSILFRARMARFGIYYLTSRSFSLASVRVAGRRVRLKFPRLNMWSMNTSSGKFFSTIAMAWEMWQGPFGLS